MLVLTRKVGEKINIDDNIVIKIVEISRGKIRIGIDAPENITILRHEIYKRVQKENLNASKTNKDAIAMAADLFKTIKK